MKKILWIRKHIELENRDLSDRSIPLHTHYILSTKMPSINIRTQCLCAIEDLMEKFESKPKKQVATPAVSLEESKLRPAILAIGDGVGRACP